MRAIVLHLAAVGAATSCAPSTQSQSISASGQWVMTFQDEFNGTQLNTSIWNVNNYSSVISQYDGHDALFIADRVAVDGQGHLVITTVLEPTEFNGVHYNMTSGWIDTQNNAYQYQGRFEASIKMPDAGAQGAWPAWWLLPMNACWPISGEIDIVEWWGGEGHYQHNNPSNPISMASTYHYGYGCSDDLSNYNIDSRWFPNMSDTTAPLIDFSADYHTFGVEWNDTALRFYVDTNTSFVRTLPTLCVTDPGFTWGKTAYMPFNPTYGILNTAVSPNSNTTWWETHNATTMVDWVRWYAWVPDTIAAAVDAVMERGADPQA